VGVGDRIRFFIEYLGVRSFYGLLGRFPRSLGLVVGRSLGILVGTVSRKRYHVADQNVTSAFANKTPSQRAALIRDVWSDLGAGLYEFARLGRLSKDQFRNEVRVVGEDHLRAAHARGKGVVLVTGHLGNWEYASWAAALTGLPIMAVARRMKNPWVNHWITALRARSGCNVIMHKNAVRESVRQLREGGVVGLLFDQRITAGGLQVPFFGRPAHTTGMPALLALRMECPIVPLRSWRENGRITVEFLPPLEIEPGPATPERVEAVTRQLNDMLERWIKERPSQWLWIHNRWKP
jgi:KDO2-lipid IV(A) lauroyltransferase